MVCFKVEWFAYKSANPLARRFRLSAGLSASEMRSIKRPATSSPCVRHATYAANEAAREKREVADRLALPKSDPESDHE